jgi:hypothetical protein
MSMSVTMSTWNTTETVEASVVCSGTGAVNSVITVQTNRVHWRNNISSRFHLHYNDVYSYGLTCRLLQW